MVSLTARQLQKGREGENGQGIRRFVARRLTVGSTNSPTRSGFLNMAFTAASAWVTTAISSSSRAVSKGVRLLRRGGGEEGKGHRIRQGGDSFVGISDLKATKIGFYEPSRHVPGASRHIERLAGVGTSADAGRKRVTRTR